jgi:hypothetical protein
MKCQSIKPIFVSTSKLAEILCSDADIKVPQCAIKSSLKRLPWRELKRLLWRWLKGYSDILYYIFTELYMKFLPNSSGYKSTSRGRELRRIQTYRPHTMSSKELEPWSPRWVRQKLRETNNDLPPNDWNHDEKPPADVERPFCKCDLDCQSHISLDHDTYDRRYWYCHQPTCPFHWG